MLVAAGIVALGKDVPPFFVLEQFRQIHVELDRDVEFGRLYFPGNVEPFVLLSLPHLLMVYIEHGIELFRVAGRFEGSENLYHFIPVELLLVD